MRKVITAYSLAQCMDAMAEYAQAFEKLGQKTIVFCEDRLTLIAEQAILKKMGGTFDTSVSTFARFLKADGKTISKQGSVMAVGKVMADLQSRGALQCFKTIACVGSNAKCIYETLAQMSASQITPEVLKSSLELLPEDTLKRKVSDLALIYEGYASYLEESGLLDESKYLALLPAYIRSSGCLKGYNVIFLGYTAFTAQARKTVEAALETADNVLGIFCADDTDAYAARGAIAFERVCAAIEKGIDESEQPAKNLRGLLASADNIGKPLPLLAERLRKGLFNPVKPKDKVKTNKICLLEAGDRTEEAEFVAVKIKRALAENPALRYRDISVLVPSVDEYALPLKKTFTEYGIPYFIDEKKSLKHHPLAQFLLACVRVAKESCSPQSVQALTQNVFFGESDEYRNYLLKFANYRGGARREIKTGEGVVGYDYENLNACRERFLLATGSIKGRGHGRDYCAAVRKILKDFHAENAVKDFAENLGDIAQRGYLLQITKALDGLLAEAEMLTADKMMTAAEFEAILQDGLDATEISLIPLKSDAVFIGNIGESRIEKATHLFAMGMTNAVPSSSADTAIVSDKEIERLAEVQALLEPTVAEVNLRGRESVCLNLCAFTESLCLSYPLTADGNEPVVSDVFRDIDGLFERLDEEVDQMKKEKKLIRRKGLSDEDFAYACSAPAPAVRRWLMENDDFNMGRTKALEKNSSVLSALEKIGMQDVESYSQKGRGQVRVERGEELFFKDGKISPTALESYFGCPFKHFAERGLGLQEREEAMVMAVDTGNFIHDLLEKTTKKIAEMPNEEAMREYAMKVGAEALKKSVYAMQQDRESGAYFVDKLLNEGVDIVAAAYRQVKNSLFEIEETERSVQSDIFRGKVDRIDGTEKYVRVIDYKTGKIDDSAGAYYTGQKLQMQLYMSELMGDRIPAGVFYFPATMEYADEDEGRFRMRGFLNGDAEALRCGDIHITEDKKSEYFPAALVNSGSTKRVMDEQTFRDFLGYSVLVAKKGVKELKDGFVAATPYGDNCKYCKYGGMCGFRKGEMNARKEKTISPKSVAEIAQNARDTKGD